MADKQRLNVILEIESEGLPLPAKELAREVGEAVLSSEGIDLPCQVCLLITDEEGIRQMNRDFGGIDAPTDVLSFPMLSLERPSDLTGIREDPSAFDLDSGELLLGDIVLCLPRVLSQAKDYGHSVRREYAFLIAHSLFHLLGYDHMSEEEARVMEEKQSRVLEELGIRR